MGTGFLGCFGESVMSEISRKFANYALTQSAFPQSAIDAAKTFTLDSLGVGIAGSKAPFRTSVLQTAEKWGQGTGAHFWGGGGQAPVASAAYVNGFQIHGMEYDCVHEPAVVHPMATIFAALSAESESNNLSGKALIEAVIIAVDIAVELGVAVTSSLKFFRPATAGLFGATLGIARLRGFDEDTAVSAMGCALAQCAGVMQAHVEGKPTLPVQIAGAARAAVVACDLAESGLQGPEASLEGPFGYFAMFEDVADPIVAADRLGNVHRITEVSWKPFPTGRAAQGGIVLAQKLKEQGATIDNVKSLTLLAPPIIPRLVDRDVSDAMTANYARLCFPFLAPTVLKYGTVGLGHFDEANLFDPNIRAFAKNVTVTTNDIADPAAFVPQTLTAELRDGSSISARIDRLFGSPQDPLTPAQHLEKFRKCVAFGLRDVNAQSVADRLITLMDKVDTLSDCAEIFDLASGQA